MTTAQTNITKAKTWLNDYAYPLWVKKGFDNQRGGFYEGLSFEGEPLEVPRRAMVQARQIFSFSAGMKMKCVDRDTARDLIIKGGEYLVSKYSLPSGGFAHAVDVSGAISNPDPDLYAQAFALFGMSFVFAETNNPEIKERAKKLVRYLYAERRTMIGGFTELAKGKVTYASNPHMHLFEAALAWMQVDPDHEWKRLAENILELAATKFVDRETGVLGEYFDDNWNHLSEDGRFVFEPGHQYEWAWLMACYEDLTGANLRDMKFRLYSQAEKHGIGANRFAMDEVWSDFSAKTKTARFWPQGERIKAAVKLGVSARSEEKAKYAEAADEALNALFAFFDTPTKGLWYDSIKENGELVGANGKASSFYHITNAMEEYLKYRALL